MDQKTHPCVNLSMMVRGIQASWVLPLVTSPFPRVLVGGWRLRGISKIPAASETEAVVVGVLFAL